MNQMLATIYLNKTLHPSDLPLPHALQWQTFRFIVGTPPPPPSSSPPPTRTPTPPRCLSKGLCISPSIAIQSHPPHGRGIYAIAAIPAGA